MPLEMKEVLQLFDCLQTLCIDSAGLISNKSSHALVILIHSVNLPTIVCILLFSLRLLQLSN